MSIQQRWLRFRKFFVHLLISHKMFLRLNCFAWFKTGIVCRPANCHRNSFWRSAYFSELSRALTHFNHPSDRFRLLNTVHIHWSRFCVKRSLLLRAVREIQLWNRCNIFCCVNWCDTKLSSFFPINFRCLETMQHGTPIFVQYRLESDLNPVQ